MSSTNTQSSLPSTSELVEGVLFYPIALLVSATIFPGLTLCIPGLILFAALVLIPLVAIALLVVVVAAVFAAPVLLVRAVRALRERRAARVLGDTYSGCVIGVPGSPSTAAANMSSDSSSRNGRLITLAKPSAPANWSVRSR